MVSNSRPVALITGASAGIGHELARVFAKNGHDLILVARNEQALKQVSEELTTLYGITCHVIPKDLSAADSAESLFQEIRVKSIPVNVLVNNAGFGAYGFFSEMPVSTMLEMMQVNMVTLTCLTRLLLEDMLKQRSGKILNVASTAAFQPGPLMAVYYASKAYVLHFTEALSNELRGSGVTATALCPGPTITGFQKRAGATESKLHKRESMVVDAAAVAEAAYEGLMKNKTIVIPGFMNRLLALSVRFGPRSMVAQIARKLQEKGYESK